eukprot:756023-Hanusia_phi.AAC.2
MATKLTPQCTQTTDPVFQNFPDLFITVRSAGKFCRHGHQTNFSSEAKQEYSGRCPNLWHAYHVLELPIVEQGVSKALSADILHATDPIVYQGSAISMDSWISIGVTFCIEEDWEVIKPRHLKFEEDARNDLQRMLAVEEKQLEVLACSFLSGALAN